MDPATNNAPLEFNIGKHKSRMALSENGSERDMGIHSSDSTIENSGQWYEDNRDYRRERDRGDRNRERSHDRERIWNRERNIHARSRDNYREQEPRDRERYRDDQQSFSTYGYGSASDGGFGDGSQRGFLSTYGLLAAMNSSQWGMNPVAGINVNSNGINVNPASTGMAINPNMSVTPNVNMNPNSGASLNPFAFMGMTGDPNFLGMMGIGNFGQFGMMGTDTSMVMGPMKEIIHLSNCVLYPPNPNSPPPTTRDRPPGCKTVFVGGLPENASEDIVKELFERCGEISTVRMSKKNFCHIRFVSEAYVDNAIYLSGYRMKIENKDDAPYTGRLHVDYAQARDDQYEWECQQRAIQREMRHRERLEQEYFRPPTPPPVVHYSDHEATLLSENLRGEETFQQAVSVLITWLERGECSKRNAGYFYSMIQSTNSHVRRLMNEKLQYEDELNKAKNMLKKQMQGILLQFTQIGKVFCAASLQKVWDHFTKPQRKNIELWKKQTEEIKNAHVEEVLNDRVEDEMDVSDDDNESNPAKKARLEGDVNNQDGDRAAAMEEVNKLHEENDSLRCQLEAYQNETVVLRSESEQERDIRERQLQALRQALQGMQQQLMMLTQKHTEDEKKLKHLRSLLKMQTEESQTDNENIKETLCNEEKDQDDSEKETVCDQLETEQEKESPTDSLTSSSKSVVNIPVNEARLIGLISTFLNVHPFGASVDYICSYLHQIDCTVKSRDVESLMAKFPSVFTEESTGIGASLERKWTFCGFKTPFIITT